MKEKHTNTGKNAVAALIMTLMIVLSIPLGVNRSFARLREDVEHEYYYDSTGYALWEGVNARRESAQNLITIAEKYVDEYPELQTPIDELGFRVLQENSYTTLEDETFTSIVKINSELTQDAYELYWALEKVPLAEKDKEYPWQIMVDLKSEQDKLHRSSYNDLAREYNARLEKFPANVLRHLSGIKPMGVFEED